MDKKRRDMIRIGSALSMAFAAGILKVGDVFGAEWSAKVFDAKSLDAVLKALGGDKFAVSPDITITAPEIAENGAVVPVAISTTLPKTEYMAILVEKNPSAMSASFTIPPGTEPNISTRVKMGTTSNVIALVKSDGKWLIATKEIKVTLGGCGG
ncbi:MAG: thiosulfate oxidation carrier protein SoxY [Herminiimonas sp.]|nr:thiosulfate oxidation carrier protein SoxY [Herminiimonas sp.]